MTKSILEKLSEGIQKHEAKKLARVKMEQAEEQKEVEEERKFWGRESKLFPKKKKLYNEILEWRDKFVKTNEFKKIFKIFDKSYQDNIIIFEGGWGHDRHGYYSCWSRLFLEKSGDLSYFAGYKWMGTGPEFVLRRNDKNDKTVRKLTYSYLKELHDHIRSEEVYKSILSKLELEERLEDEDE